MTNKNRTWVHRYPQTLSRSMYLFSLFVACMLWTTNTQATTCGSATTITPASLPISGQTVVCGGTNDITYAATATSVKTGGCTSGSYYGGNEALYVFTPTTTGVYNIALSGQTYTMIMVTWGCPTVSGSTCVNGIANSSISKNINVDLFAGQTYYIMFDIWPFPVSPCPGTFSMSYVSPPPTTPAPWSESFPSATLPTGWALSSYSGPNNIIAALNNGGSSTNYLYKNLWSSAPTGSFTTINVGPLAGTEYLSFKYKLANYSSPYAPPAAGSGNFTVAISTNYGSSYTNIATVSNNGLAGWQDVNYSLAAYTGQYVKVKITGNWTSLDYYLGFDDFEIDDTPGCLAPTSPTGYGWGETEAIISWTAPGLPPSNGYQYAVTTFATPPGSGTPFAGTNTTVSGLTPATTYYLHVRSDCGAGDYSSWVTSPSFMTDCPIYSVPWTENFDGVTIPAFPVCWKKENGDWVTTNNSSSANDADARSGTQFLREAYGATNEYMWTPGFLLTAGNTYEFKFWWAGDNYSGWTGDVFINYGQDSLGALQLGTSFVTPGTTTTKTYVQETYSFTPSVTGQYNFAIRVNASGVPWYLSFDDFEVTESTLPVCSGTPSGGTATASINPICPNGNFNLSLTGASTGELGLTYLWESADDAAFTVNLSTVGTNETQTTSQTSDKYYRCIVACTNSGLSDTSTAVLVTTNTSPCQCNSYCLSNFTTVTYEHITNVTFAGINNTSAGNTGGPVDYTSFSGSVEQGATYPLSVTIDPDANDYVYAWIDWNGDGDYGDAGETYTLATATGSAGPHTLNITVPCTATLGSTRMRVMVDYGNATPNPCRSATWGEAEDYCISIGQQTLTPAGSVTSDKLNDEICVGSNINLTANGGNLGDGGTWQWYTGSCGGTNVGSGASINVSPATTTTYYVRGEVCNVATSCTSITVNVKTLPPAQSVIMPFIGMPANACPGTTANLSIPAVANATMYTWDGPPGTTFDGNASPYTSTTPSAAIVFGTPNTSLYSIGVQAGNGCGNSLRKIQKVRYSVSVPSAVNGDATVCANTNGKVYSLPSASVGATSYQWTITGDASINGQGNSATTSSLNVTIDFGPSWNGGTLCVAAKTSCYTSATKCKVIGTASGSFGIITGSTTACPNTNETYAVTAGTGIATYTWTVPTNTSINSGQGTNSINLNYNSSYNNVGNICVTATSICGVVSAPKCRTVAPGVAKVPASISGNTNGLCSGLSVVYSTPLVPGVSSYNWTVTGGSIASGQGSNSISVDFGSFTTGQVCVSATNGCGTSASRCVTIKGSPSTPLSITADPSSWCAYDAGILFTADVSNVTGTYTLSWAYPNTTTYVMGGGNTTSLTLDWGASNGVVMVTASNACGNGTATLSSNLGCREGEMSASALNVYPNPTAGMLNVEYTTEKGTAQVTVLDLSGRVVMTQTQSASEGRNTMQLDLSRVAKGAYMLNVQTQSGNNQVRIVVE